MVAEKDVFELLQVELNHVSTLVPLVYVSFVGCIEITFIHGILTPAILLVRIGNVYSNLSDSRATSILTEGVTEMKQNIRVA
jgi:hypothetical protein